MNDRIALLGVIVVSVFVVIADLAISIMLFFNQVPPENKEAASIMWGGINLALGMIIQYWIGTSRSSAAKDQTIATLTKPPP